MRQQSVLSVLFAAVPPVSLPALAVPLSSQRTVACSCVPMEGEDTPRDDQFNRVLTAVGTGIEHLASAVSTTAAGDGGAEYQQSQVLSDLIPLPCPYQCHHPHVAVPVADALAAHTPAMQTDRAGPESGRLRHRNVKFCQWALAKRSGPALLHCVCGRQVRHSVGSNGHWIMCLV